VSDVCYDLLDYMQQYHKYLDNLKIINVSSQQEFIDKKFSALSDATVDSLSSDANSE